MAIRYSDQEIQTMVSVVKTLPNPVRDLLQFKLKRGHKQCQMEAVGADGNTYRIVLRQSLLNPLDFSVILALRPKNSNRLFRLRRHNGKSHEHKNAIECDVFYDFHIHESTERYQELGTDEDGYAEPTGAYTDLQSALVFLLKEANIKSPGEAQQDLFEEE